MENASKALIIAGAILLAILIIGIGMYIYSSSHNTLESAKDQMSEQDKTSFNQQWNTYEGAQGGNTVKSLLQKIIANCNTNAQEESRLVGVHLIDSKNNWRKIDVNKNNLEQSIMELTALRNFIEPRHTYYVTLDFDTSSSLVHTIIIRYNENQDTVDPGVS